jgi:hypothetical protein
MGGEGKGNDEDGDINAQQLHTFSQREALRVPCSQRAALRV